MRSPAYKRAPGWLITVGFVLVLGGCGDFILGYRGPQPAAENIASEVAIVREIFTGGESSFILERTRFTAADDPRNINRVIAARVSAGLAAEVDALALRHDERVIISTEFVGFSEGSGTMRVPNWPPTSAIEYPIGAHRLTAIARAP